MQSTYNLAKYKDGLQHFARVTVEAEPADSGVAASDSIIEPISREQAEVSREHFADWIDAAVRGARLCGEALVQQRITPGCQIVVVRVGGTLVDTGEEDVACAAALATWQAVAPGRELPSFEFAEGRWKMAFY